MACEACLRRSALLATLAPRIARRRPSRRELLGLLALPDNRLTATVGAEPEITAQAPTGSAICRHDPGYPSALAELSCPPATLHVSGALRERFPDLLDGPVVGSSGAAEARGSAGTAPSRSRASWPTRA